MAGSTCRTICPRSARTTLRGHAGLPYAELAAQIMALFAGDAFSAAELRRMAEQAYRGFRHAAVAPLVQLDERLWLLELFHGPTLAFKDLALQLVGLLFDAALARRREHVTIIGATSGDTGSAALEACRDRDAIDIFILYPHGRISEVQRRQMTTVDAPNAHAIAIEGTFDDCQDLVKALFADTQLRHALNLAAVNSINWARIAAQTVYYFAAAAALGAPDRPVSFSVPTGNFGNVYAGHVARRMGLPIERLVIGTNRNDILARYIANGEMTIAAGRAEPEPEHGHPGVEQFRAAAVRAERPQRRRGRRGDRGVSPHRRPAADGCRNGARRTACFPPTRSTTLRRCRPSPKPMLDREC